MIRRYVKSSDIESIGYDSATGVLEVKFLGGSAYQYNGVEPDIYSGLMKASSKGSYLANHIKRGGYSYRKLKKNGD